jgi:CelD/BcsL family acetyltransferase involved in cellulose biosynthesis
MRTKIRSLKSRLEKKYNVQYDICEKPEKLNIRLQSLFDLHYKRWKLKGHEGVFKAPEKKLFYANMAKLFQLRGWLRFYSLSVNCEFVAHQFCFQYRQTMFLLQEGFDPAWLKNGVGNILRAYVFRDCIARKVKCYDFLSGVTDHKLSWGGQIKCSIRVEIGKNNIKNMIYFGVPYTINQGKAILKIILPSGFIAWTKKIFRN